MKFIIEQSAYSGVLKIAGKVAHDMELVTGTLPEIRVVMLILLLKTADYTQT